MAGRVIRIGVVRSDSDGIRSAKLLKLSQRGLFIKSWEGQLNIIELGSEGGVKPWGFTVRDGTLAMHMANHIGHKMAVTYVQYAGYKPWMYSSSYDVTEFECSDPSHPEWTPLTEGTKSGEVR
jgi:hypothetical protein